MPILRLEDVMKDINYLREEGTAKGLQTGFDPLDDIFSVKKGFTLYVGGAPHHGKTEFTNQLALSMACKYGWKTCIYSGEAGGIANTILELAHTLIGKPAMKSSKYCMDESEMTYAMAFISEHFKFIDTEDERSTIQSFTMDQFYKIIQESEFKFDMTVLDPFNDTDNETSKYGGREDIWLAEALRSCRRDAKKFNRYNVVVFHVADVKPIKNKGDMHYWVPPALPTQWAGGRTPQRRAHSMLLCYRPPVSQGYEENELKILHQKAKPKGIGSVGECSMFWDWKTNRYYWQQGSQYKTAFSNPKSILDEDPF